MKETSPHSSWLGLWVIGQIASVEITKHCKFAIIVERHQCVSYVSDPFTIICIYYFATCLVGIPKFHTVARFEIYLNVHILLLLAFYTNTCRRVPPLCLPQIYNSCDRTPLHWGGVTRYQKDNGKMPQMATKISKIRVRQV